MHPGDAFDLLGPGQGVPMHPFAGFIPMSADPVDFLLGTNTPLETSPCGRQVERRTRRPSP